MFKTILAAASVAVLLFATGATSEAAPRRCGAASAGPYYYQTAAAPGYRSYSYEPGFAPAATYRAMRSSASRPSYLDAGSKALGRYGK